MSAIGHVAIVGRDAAAWIAALGLQRALGRTGLRITMVELPPQLPAAHAFSAVPSLGGLNRALGLDARALLGQTSGIPILGQRFVGWSGQGSSFLHGYDSHRATVGEIDFVQFWTMARGEGMRVPYEAFSVAAAAAQQGRMARPEAQPGALGDLSPGFHLDARAFVETVGSAALRSGIAHLRTGAVTVEREGERILAVGLDDGARIEADLFVDATGVEALLIGGQPGAALDDWRHWLPADRLIFGTAPRLDPLPSFANITAFQAGWLGMFPLQDRTAVIGAFDSALIGADEMAQTAAAVIGRPLGGAAVREFRAGAQRRPWIGNCVAIGEAAVRLEPLDGVELHLVHLALSHLISLFPVEAEAMPEASAYNLVIGAHAAHVRDFQIAHYRLNQRSGEPWWDAARAAAPPEALAHRIAAFAARGNLPVYDDESFEPQNWAAIFLGHGLVPRDYLPMVDETPREEAMAKFQGFLHAIAEEVKAMPSVTDYLAGSGALPGGPPF